MIPNPSSSTGDPAAAVLQDLIREPIATCLGSAGACLDRVRGIRDAYGRLDRSRIGADQVLELKFACLHWRRSFLTRLQKDPPAWLGTDHTIVAAVLGALHTRLPDTLVRLLSTRMDANSLHYLLALQGQPSKHYPEFRDLAGPGVTLNIRANRSSPWAFERWKSKPEFSRYRFSGDGIEFRGLHIRPGDILLANVNIDGNGVYTTLSDPARFSSHAAVVAILEDDHGRYPAAIETFEKGVRAVPLNVFLGPRFSAYVEVYRHVELDESHAPRINRGALDMMARVRGYNFDSREDRVEHVSCCGVGRSLHLDAGLAPVSYKSRIDHARIRENLEKLDYRNFDFFAPVDYLLDERFRFTGWVDNHQFRDLLARELVEGYFRELFMTRALNPRRFPFMSRVNHWGIRQIRRQTPAGKLISLIEGFDPQTLPRGPDALLSVITIAEAQLGRLIRRTARDLDLFGQTENYFSLAEFAASDPVRDYLRSRVTLSWLE